MRFFVCNLNLNYKLKSFCCWSDGFGLIDGCPVEFLVLVDPVFTITGEFYFTVEVNATFWQFI